MKQIRLMSGLAFSVLLLLCGPAQAQSLERSLKETFEILPIGKDQRTGHEKCQGKGHHRDDGHGHAAGECDDDGGETTEPGPVEGAVIGVIAPVCEAMTIDSSWQRYSCTLAQGEAAFADTAVEYTQTLEAYAVNLQASVTEVAGGTVIGVLGSIGNGATGLLATPRPGPAPQPVIPGELSSLSAVLDSNVAQVQAYAADYAGTSIASIGTVTATAVDNVLSSIGNGATGLLATPRPGPAPQPVLPAELVILQQPLSDLAAYPEQIQTYSANYAPVVFDAARDFTQIAIAGVVTAGGDSATGLLATPRPGPAPQPVIPSDLVGIQTEATRYVEYTSTATTYVTQTADVSATIVAGGAQTVISSAGNGATGLLATPRPGPAPQPVRQR